MVITVAVLLVLGIGRVLSWGSDASGGGDDQAVQAAADSSPSADPSDKKSKKKGKKDKGKGDKGKKTPSPTPTPTPPAQPTGPCPDSDVLVTPSVPSPVAGRDVTILLNFQTGTTAACTWHVSAETVTLTVGAGPDDVWSSEECPTAIPSQDIVIRQAEPTVVAVTWNAKRSDEYCTVRTAWVLPGVYQLGGAALGGEPTVVDVELTTPTAEVVTQTAKPTQKPGQEQQN